MFDEFFGIPAHPLLVHAAVVFVPLQVAAAIAYALVPFTRRHIWWLVGALAVAAPVAAWFAKLSGEAFVERESIKGTVEVNPTLGQQITEHQEFADITAWASIGLGVLMLALLALLLGASRRGRTTAATGDPGGPGTAAAKPNAVVGLVLAVAIVAVGAVTAYYLVRSGHTGATAVWQGQ